MDDQRQADAGFSSIARAEALADDPERHEIQSHPSALLDRCGPRCSRGDRADLCVGRALAAQDRWATSGL